MRRLAKERRKLESEVAETKDDAWFTLQPAADKLKWKVGIVGPAEYALNPTGSSEARRSPYAGCVFPLSITFKASYPMTPPKVKFEVPVYHPQVVLKGESIGQMCADFVSGGWTPKMTVRDVLEKVLQLLASPEPDGALEAEVGAQMKSDLEAFEKQAASYASKYCKPEGAE